MLPAVTSPRSPNSQRAFRSSRSREQNLADYAAHHMSGDSRGWGNVAAKSCAAEHRDAVVVLPGIMGSELVETATGRVLWGISDLRWYGTAWTTGGALAALLVTDEEREGHTGRIRASRLLRFP